MKSKILTLGIALAALIAASTDPAEAALLQYTLSGTGVSGSLGTTNFTNAAYSFTQTVDTSQIITELNTPPGFTTYSTPTIDMVFTIGGVGTGLASQLYFFSSPEPGFNTTYMGVRGSLLSITAFLPGLNNYDLQTALSPITTGITVFSVSNEPTTLGSLTFTLSSISSSTFQVVDVPEPSATLGLLVVGITSGLTLYRRRSNKQTANS